MNFSTSQKVRLQAAFGKDGAAALLTEWRTLSHRASFDFRSDHVVLRCPEFPGWFEVNAFYLLNPGGRSLDEWFGLYREDFPAEPYRHVLMLMPEGEAADQLQFEAARLGLKEMSFRFRCLDQIPSQRPLPDGFRIRPLNYRHEVDDLLTFNLSVHADEPWFDGEAGMKMLLDRAIEKTEYADIHWFAVSPVEDDRILAKMGVFKCGDVCRMQDVATDPVFRRRGFCESLLRYTVRYAFECLECTKVLLLNEVGSEAERVYERVGFRLMAPKFEQIYLFPGNSESV